MFNFLKSLFSSTPPSPENLAAAKQVVENLITSNKIAIFSKTYCPYCVRAKDLVASLGQTAGIVELDQVSNGSDIQAYLAQRTGASRVTVPQVYVGGKLLGGCSEIQALHAAGRLVPLFK